MKVGQLRKSSQQVRRVKTKGKGGSTDAASITASRRAKIVTVAQEEGKKKTQKLTTPTP